MHTLGNPFANPFSRCTSWSMPADYNGIPAFGFDPYDENGGTIVAIATNDAVVIASDTRLCDNNFLHSNDQPKLFQLGPKTILGSTGCWTDTLALTNLLRVQIRKYEYANLKTMSTEAIAHLLSIIVYSRRLVLPYRTYNLLAGLSEQGKGFICTYDGLGHMIMEKYSAVGSALRLLYPLLDSQIDFRNVQLLDGEEDRMPITTERAVSLVKDCFITAAERDVMTGDSMVLKTISENGIQDFKMELRSD